MKELKSIFIFAIVLLFLQSCEQRNSKGINSVICEREELGLQSLEITSGDTVNVTDVKGLKQGYWIVFGFEPTGDKGPNETKEVMSNSVQHTIIEKGTVWIFGLCPSTSGMVLIIWIRFEKSESRRVDQCRILIVLKYIKRVCLIAKIKILFGQVLSLRILN